MLNIVKVMRHCYGQVVRCCYFCVKKKMYIMSFLNIKWR